MAAAGTLDLNFEQASLFSRCVTLQNNDINKTSIDLTGFEFVSQIRNGFEFGSKIIGKIDIIVLDAVKGEIELFVSALVTQVFTFEEAFYDILLLPGGDKTRASRILQGKITLTRGITEQMVI